MSNNLELRNLKAQMESLGRDTVEYIKQILLENDKLASGNLISSLNYNVITQIDTVLLDIIALDYFKYVDEGRKPGKMPPIKPILKWVEMKGISIGKYSDKQTAFIIARSIGKKGIKPLNIKNRLVSGVLNKREQILKDAAAQDIQVLLDKIIPK